MEYPQTEIPKNSLNDVPDIKGHVVRHSIGGHWVGADKEPGNWLMIFVKGCPIPMFIMFMEEAFHSLWSLVLGYISITQKEQGCPSMSKTPFSGPFLIG